MTKRTTRDNYRLKLDQAKGNLKTASNYLQQFANEYHDRYPELSLQALNIIEFLKIAQDAIDRLKGDF